MGTWHDLDVGRPIAAPLERCAQLLGVDLATVRKVAANVERSGYRRAMTLESWAKAQVERLIGPLGNRWAHVQAVARQAHRVAAVLSAEDGDVLVAAAFLHDVGYAPSLNRLGFHPVDGARFRILQLAEDEGAITANPLRQVPPPKWRADPEKVLGQAKRRVYTPEEAGRLLAACPLFWWDHVLALLGTGLRFGEFAGLRRRRVHLERTPPVLQVVDVRYQAGRYGSGFKPRPKSDAASARSRSPHL